MNTWTIGLAFSLVGGGITMLLVDSCLKYFVGDIPAPKDRKRVPPSFTGFVERLFFSILAGSETLAALSVPALMLTWIGLKLATNWNSKAYEEKPELRRHAFRALILGLLSMTFALVGGLICRGVVPLPFFLL